MSDANISQTESNCVICRGERTQKEIGGAGEDGKVGPSGDKMTLQESARTNREGINRTLFLSRPLK